MPSVARQITQWTRNEIKSLFKQGKYICRHDYFDVRVAPAQKDVGRVLIVTPRKIGNAVKRNTIRRRLKSIFYTYHLYTKGYDWLIFAKPGSAGTSYHDLRTLVIDNCLPALLKLSSQHSMPSDHS